MFIHSLQRRAFGVELWALIPTRDQTGRTYFVRVRDRDQPDRHFSDATAALDTFFAAVQEAMLDAEPPGAQPFEGHATGFNPQNDRR